MNNVHEKGIIIFLTVHIVDLLFILGKTGNKNPEPKNTKKERGGRGEIMFLEHFTLRQILVWMV